MNDINIFCYVKVAFPTGNRLYTYKTAYDVKPGDYVIIDSPFNGLVVVKVHKVIEASELNPNFEVKWVVQTIDTTHYAMLMKEEKNQVGSEALKEIKKRL